MMRAKRKWVFAILVLTLTILACGSNSNIVVKPPEDDTNESNVGNEGDDPEEGGDVQEMAGGGEETEAEATKAVGTARSNPAPVGSEVIADQMAFKVLGATRPADDIVHSGNQFNKRPETGEEYLLVEFTVTCLKSSDEQCSFTPYNMKVLGSAGLEHNREFISGVYGIYEDMDLYGGATATGYLPFIIKEDETDLLLVYEPFWGDTFYLMIPDSDG